MAADNNGTDYQNPFQVFVEVNADFYDDGTITPRSFVWEDGRRFEIDKILDIDRQCSLKAGSPGKRYTIMVCGKKTHLWHDRGRWFMERKYLDRSK